MAETTLILGGAASGKSRVAVERAKALGSRVVFIGTGPSADPEMRTKIEAHRRERPADWKTFEPQGKVAGLLRMLGATADVLVLDSVTATVGNLLVGGTPPDEILSEGDDIAEAAVDGLAKVILVSDEVGQGVVPEHALGRRFRDYLGRVNRALAARVHAVDWMVAGIPVRLKGKA